MYSQAACCASASTCTGMRAASEMRSTVGPLRYESSVWRTGSPTSSPEEPWPSCALGSTRQIRDFAGAGAAAVPPAFATDAAAANAILAASDTDESTSWFVVMASTPRAKLVWRASLIRGAARARADQNRDCFSWADVRSDVRSEREDQAHPRAALGGRELDRAAELVSAAPHVAEPAAGLHAGRVTAAVVDHVDENRGSSCRILASSRNHRDLGCGCVLQNVGQRFLQDAQNLQDPVRAEVGQRRQIGNLPQESQPGLLHAALIARAEVGQHRQQVAFHRIARIDDQAQIVERAAQDRFERLETRIAFDDGQRMHELTADA